MTLVLRGKTYETEFLDLLQLSIGESRTLKRNCVGLSGKAMTGADWRECVIAFDREDPDLFAGIVFLLRSRAGEIVEWAYVEDVTVKEFAEGFSIVNDEVVDLPDPPPEPVEATEDAAV